MNTETEGRGRPATWVGPSALHSPRHSCTRTHNADAADDRDLILLANDDTEIADVDDNHLHQIANVFPGLRFGRNRFAIDFDDASRIQWSITSTDLAQKRLIGLDGEFLARRSAFSFLPLITRLTN